MKSINIKDPADRFDLSYVFANNFASFGKNKSALVEMCEIAKNIAPGVHARAVLVHPGDIHETVSLLKGSPVRSEVVIDFPDGLGGAETKFVQAKVTKEAGAVGGDVVLNLHKVATRDEKGIRGELLSARKHLEEVKVIAQVPYLWQYDRESLPWLLPILAECGVYCLKDWTTRTDNFLLPDGDELDYTLETRLGYIKYLSDYISSHSLPLILKVAGKVTKENVFSFVSAGAVLIGTSYRKAESLRKALLEESR